jgi:hypothetical protein
MGELARNAQGLFAVGSMFLHMRFSGSFWGVLSFDYRSSDVFVIFTVET